MKNSFLLLLLVLVLASCSTYQEVLKSDDISLKYSWADSLYQEGKFKKSLKLWEQIVPTYRGRPQAERVMFLYSDTYYQLEDFYLAGYQFERFTKAYPQSEKREEAAFKSAIAYYQLSPDYYLDQVDTQRALDKLQNFINYFPKSERIDSANAMVKQLNTKLEKKQLEIAKQYHKIAESQFTYPAAIKALDIFISDNPGSIYRQEALYYKLDSAYQYALGSRDDLVNERLLVAKKAYANLVKYFPDGEYTALAAPINEDINERLAPAIN